ncbi:MAG: hypothetical protein ACFE9I_18680 [Candidatus Hermodarchaeota archaeon]
MVEEKDKKEENKDILLEDSYEVHVTAHNIADYDNYYNYSVLNVNKQTVDFLFEIVSLLKCESEDLAIYDNDFTNNKFIRVKEALSPFRSNLVEKNDLEDILINYINGLNDYKFTRIEEGPYKGSPDFKEVEVTISELIEKLKSIRDHKIKFYNKVLEEYKKDKEEYNSFFKASNF